MEHAIKYLEPSQKIRLRIFTFGGGSFIPPEMTHPDSHNYASAADFVCRFGSPNLQIIALERYHGRKNGLTDSQIIYELALRDGMLYLETNNLNTLKAYIQSRTAYYEKQFTFIRNLTILDPDPDSNWKHKFSSDCYQNAIKNIIHKIKSIQNGN